jgi:DNA-binding XRE family transcriptional regulator
VFTEPSSSPVAFFAAELKRVRALAGVTQEALAKATAYASATVAAIETCRLLPSKEFAQQADVALAADGHFERLQALVEQSAVIPWFRDLVETERKALSIQTYESYVMPGLLQTEAYARCAVNAVRPRLSDDEIERAVVLRMTRQQIIQNDNPPRMWVIIDESVLRRQVGGPEVMHDQCAHLLAMGLMPHIAVQVIPDAIGATCASGRPFLVLTFAKQSPMAYFEDMRSARYIRDRDEVGIYSVIFDYLRSSALDDEKSSQMIRGYRDGYGSQLV